MKRMALYIQYFFTRERVTEERRNQYGVSNETGTKVQEASLKD